jgi:hypothetical protein
MNVLLGTRGEDSWLCWLIGAFEGVKASGLRHCSPTRNKHNNKECRVIEGAFRIEWDNDTRPFRKPDTMINGLLWQVFKGPGCWHWQRFVLLNPMVPCKSTIHPSQMTVGDGRGMGKI